MIKVKCSCGDEFYNNRWQDHYKTHPECRQINKEIPTALLGSEVSKYKNSIMTPSEVKSQAQGKLYSEIADIYEKYEEHLLKNNLVDFDDLLLLPYKILKNNQKLAESTSQKMVQLRLMVF